MVTINFENFTKKDNDKYQQIKTLTILILKVPGGCRHFILFPSLIYRYDKSHFIFLEQVLLLDNNYITWKLLTVQEFK